MGKKKRRHEKIKKELPMFESDEYHYFIVGYTSGGASYGMTWEEAEALGMLDENPGSENSKNDQKRNHSDDEDIPF